jgi:hypothetical protein
MPSKGDVSDWLDDGEGSAEKLAQLAEGATVWLRVASSRPTRGKGEPTPRELVPDAPSWFSELRLTNKGAAFLDLRNVMIALRVEPALKCFRFDEMQQDAMLIRELPLAPGARPAPPTPHALTDDDVGRVQEWLQQQALPRIGREIVGQAIHMKAREDRFHPVRDWLGALKWDGTERLNGWLATYLGATGNPKYLAAIGRMFLIAMVARIYKPGCKADYVLVLEGKQGDQKSQACEVLAGEWFSDSLPDIRDKDAKLHLRGKWLVEIAEFAAFMRAGAERLKAFITRTHERYRPPYFANDVIEPRQCVCVATVNVEDYNEDETGGRRLWPVRVGRIDIPALIRDREQLFAEAVVCFQRHEKWWPDAKFERRYIAGEQDARYEPGIYEEKIGKYLASLNPKRTTLVDVAVNALKFEDDPERPVKTLVSDDGKFSGFRLPNRTPINRASIPDEKRIIKALRHLGWGPNRNEKARFWAPKTPRRRRRVKT